MPAKSKLVTNWSQNGPQGLKRGLQLGYWVNPPRLDMNFIRAEKEAEKKVMTEIMGT